jgi:hypothetical protein
MASDNTRNTATTDRKPEDEPGRDETPDTEESREPSVAPADTDPDTPATAKDSREPSAAPADTDTPATHDDHQPGSSDTDAPDDSAGSTDSPTAGAGAIVSAGLGLVSLTGTGVSDMLRSRQEIVGQIEASVGSGAIDQVAAFYGSPWHTAALVNGTFALVAVLVGGLLLAAHPGRTTTQPWVRAIALGGVVLGGIGIIVATGMYFDLFAPQPVLPAAPALGG